MNLCDWGDKQRRQGLGGLAVDCSAMSSNDTSITCLTNPLPKQAEPPLGAASVDVATPDGRADASAVAWAYLNLWSSRTTWGGNEPVQPPFRAPACAAHTRSS